MASPAPFLRVAARGARDSLSANFVPFLLLQGFGFLVVASYYGLDSTRALWDDVAQAKARSGIVFSALSTSFFAGLLPFGLSRLSRGMAREEPRHLPWLLVYWAWHGCVVDVFYRSQALLFGDNARPATIIAKVLIDQLVFTPVISIPMMVLAYAWKDGNYTFAGARTILGPRWYAMRGLPLLGASWMVWTPAITLIYTLPLALQLPVANLVQALWSLLLLFLTRQEDGAREDAAST